MLLASGRKFGELTVLYSALYITNNGREMGYMCQCSCGDKKVIKTNSLIKGLSESCGYCEHPVKHKLEYKSWDSMKQRCLNPNAPDYKRYGGRGITICLPWKLHFMNFYRDMGDCPININGERFTLNRLDNDGPYEKNNCNWADKFEQQNNKRTSLSGTRLFYSNGNKRKLTT